MTRLALLTVLLMAAGGCSGNSAPRVCTLIGCNSGLTTHLATMPAASFRIEVRTTGPGSSPAYVYECADVAQCHQDVFFPSFIPDQAWVTVTVGSASTTTELVQITYTTNSPNGDDCPPHCLQAQVQVAVPA